MPLNRFPRQYEQLSLFERERIITLMEAGWTAKRVARHLGRSDCVARKGLDQWIDESRFNLSSDDNRVRVWRPCSEHLNRALALQRHTAPTAEISYESRRKTLHEILDHLRRYAVAAFRLEVSSTALRITYIDYRSLSKMCFEQREFPNELLTPKDLPCIPWYHLRFILEGQIAITSSTI
ncbi:uncharacterized protein TNCV_3281331 [Trichonephila clavipes]|nr:uncharacterized protein TNCV_3281331 [Trichonephila clavipes]